MTMDVFISRCDQKCWGRVLHSHITRQAECGIHRRNSRGPSQVLGGTLPNHALLLRQTSL